ncbi:Ger(x)C family spore germination C-terminal domain-containing protein [Paenibacillus sp. MWE-103]|uniref:Ger(X)C family spore germination C-terminal domain-containing protein n=1 Tax=Paenibacillus artemisiicola TaxID=1172618 RepID=A0ABS3WCP5_9BACL|nr:Ger(x)C family spore germination C-terminal domain-containing protein [Paenibacillus artemisiicola]MBO7746085.1 Ger(x)C family spore germination C-terminal domain-containing protein [Paenibacillus artemisiicola]
MADVEGLRWISKHFGRQVITLEDGDRGKAAVAIRELKVSRHVEMKDGKPILRLRVRIKGTLSELSGQIDRQTINRLAEQKIEQEIRRAYEAGIKKHADLFNLEEMLYRYHLKTWRALQARHWKPDARELEANVEFVLKYAGVFELK